MVTAVLSLLGVLALVGGLLWLGWRAQDMVQEHRAYRARCRSILQPGEVDWSRVPPGSEAERVLLERDIAPRADPRRQRDQVQQPRPDRFDRMVEQGIGLVFEAIAERLRRNPADTVGDTSPRVGTVWTFVVAGNGNGQLELEYPPSCSQEALQRATTMRDEMARRGVTMPTGSRQEFQVSDDGKRAWANGRLLFDHA